jgi:N6-L-threonylcarbamoyladenine synthase
MHILAIDTSFDDTAAAVVSDTKILSNVLSTDLSQHQEYGGVVPRLARASHQKNIDSVIALALRRAHVHWEEIDAIAVTQGPGLAICLEVGIAKAKELGTQWKKPLIPVNHMEGHLLSCLAQSTSRDLQLSDVFPTLGILISGGHTQFVYATSIGEYEIVGETQDDAIGEAYDKIGRMLGLGYPAGPFLEKMAREGRPGVVKFPVPMRQIKSADLSYSGLKTAAMRIIEKYETLSKQDIADIALGFQTAAITHLVEKLTIALQEKDVKSLLVGGGVIKNLAVRKALRSFANAIGVPIYFPNNGKLCTDNAGMIGIAAALHPVFEDTFDRKPTLRLSRSN